MIEKLTSEQQEQLIKFREICLEIGLSTLPIKREDSEHREIVDFIYKQYLNLPSPAIWYVDSPLMLNLIINIIFSEQNLGQNLEQNLGQNIGQNLGQSLRQNLEQNLGQNLEQNLWQNLWQNLEQNLWQNLRQNLRQNLEQSLRQDLGQNLWQNLKRNLEQNLWQDLKQNLGQNLGQNLWQDLVERNLGQNLEQNLRQNLWQDLELNLELNLRQNLEHNLWQNLERNLWQNLRQNLRQNLEQSLRQDLGQNLWQNLGQNLKRVENIYWGNNDIYWLSFYIFPEKYLGISYTDFQSTSLNYFYKLCERIGWIWYFNKICFISDRPIELHKKGIQLHKETGPAMLFKDGYALWCLNGVNIPREIIETPAEKLDPQLLIKEKNAEVRKEIIRKIGMGRILQKLEAKKLDGWREYELYKIDNIDIEPVCILKMTCPSKGVFYSLRVPPQIINAREAAKWINWDTDPEEYLIET